MNSRIVKSREELEAWLTKQLRSYPDCENCSIYGVNGLQQPDLTGCNWSEGVFINYSNANKGYVNTKVSEVVMGARQLFNIS